MRGWHSVFLLVLFAQPSWACKCEMALSACNEVNSSNLVFSGTVQSIDPIFLSRWSMVSQSSMKVVNQAFQEAWDHPSSVNLAQLKEAFSKAFPSLSAAQKSPLQAATTAAEVASLFYSATDRGMRIRFQVKTLFRHKEDDDDQDGADDDDDDDDDQEFFDIWTSFGDCGYDFQVGETYLVYANNDEDSGYISTSICTRTRRLSEAGDDLAYLFFYKDAPKQSARLEGFTTTKAIHQLDFDSTQDTGAVSEPAADIVVELQSDRLKRYAQSDKTGRFVFDALPEGNYQLSAFTSGYPFAGRQLAGPQPLHIEQKGCAHQVLLLPPKDRESK